MNPPEMMNVPDIGMVVRISDVDGFANWLSGQTMPYVIDCKDPTDWAYYDDYRRYILGLPIID